MNTLLQLLRCEVVPAIGCTEPIAVALCVARAKELLGAEPDEIVVYLSKNVYKNALAVGIPNTGMTGLPLPLLWERLLENLSICLRFCAMQLPMQ